MSNQKHQTTSRDAQETRARIIAAAYQVLAQKGYEATTLREISKAAEAAPGLVHYYFGGKDQLLVEVLKAVSERYTRVPEQPPQSALSDEQDWLQAALQLPIDRIIDEPEWFRLRHELFALGLHNALMAPKVRDLLAEGRTEIADSIRQMPGETTVEPEKLATLLLAFFDGLALQKIMDPDLDLGGFAEMLATVLRAFTRQEH
ncbi:TetR family transcriptional regulator [Dictyobacter sp. S3.2.2.5]|uniref:TetR family transcriptional regulator n=1 Tax=Dictyobacter halimunensis TaxID=3026934 RepID=A0ABQ6G201_9CHLR|nr:TetR family transcriptional regulator [Dictyobacter sp. S3.2.2.5]